MPDHWIEHRREDGELLGWIRDDAAHDADVSDAFVALDLLGREITGPVDWFDAEAALETRGLSYLSDPYVLEVDGRLIRVRLTEVSTHGIRVKEEDFGAIDVQVRSYDLSFPAPATLTPLLR